MLTIKTTGVEDYLDGSANIKALIIGGPGAGKTRTASFWPKPIFLDCENGRGSLADRNMPYAEVKSSKDMLDALEYLKGLERTPKAQRQFQTVVVDTADSFQRIVKDEWVQQTKAQAFSGFDAWGFLDTKMQLLFTRLLNLDYNVLVLVHYKDKQYKDGDNTVRELTLQLQGNIGDTIFNDFGLVGWLGTYWAASDDGRVQKRGLTFQPTPDKPFLKDRFHVTPKWMEIDFSDNDYQQIFEAFCNRSDLEDLPESATVGEIPDSEKQRAAADGPIAKPVEGGPLPPRAPAAPPEIPLEKQTKEQLMEVAKGLGVTVRGNTLKSEILTLINEAKSRPMALEPQPEATNTNEGVRSEPEPELPSLETPPMDPSQQPSSEESSKDPAADAQAASSERSEPTATSSGPGAGETPPMTPEEVASRLGGQVIAEEKNDTPTPQASAHPTPEPTQKKATGPAGCADCGRDLHEEWADPSKRDYIRLSFVKFRRYLCTGCYSTAVKS